MNKEEQRKIPYEGMKAPKTKKEWIAFLLKHRRAFSLWRRSEGHGWLTILPDGNATRIRPVPYVMVKSRYYDRIQRALAQYKMRLQWCTLHLVPGYHYPKDYGVWALCRPADSWWQKRVEVEGT